jgi:hypothetical protein
MATAADVLAIHLACRQYLLDSLEAVCARSAEQRNTFQKLRRALQFAHDFLSQPGTGALEVYG